ncbi:MAG: hypothetical protein LC792_17705 [Actinobacteria bacterium]|nr:hypothetical protein [Actinomycetota bacterium]
MIDPKGLAPTAGAPEPRRPKLTPKRSAAIIGAVRAGQYVETAAAVVGVNKDTIYRWLRIGARRGWEVERPPRAPDRYEAACAKLSDALTRAWAESESADVEGILRAGTTHATETTTTVIEERDAAGNLTGTRTTTVTRLIPPDAKMLAWHASHRFGPRWAERSAVEHSGPEGGAIPVAVDIEGLAAKVRSLRGEVVDGEVVELQE